MIKAVFSVLQSGEAVAFKMSGHAGAGTEGNDVVCAAVSGAVQCVIAVIEAELGLAESFSVSGENTIRCNISNVEGEGRKVAETVLGGFMQLMEEWERDFPKNITVKKQLI